MKTETKKSINYLLLLFTFLAGVIWWGLGEVFISMIKVSPADDYLRNTFFNGFYFAFLSLLTIFACLLAERIKHSIVDKYFFGQVVWKPSLRKIVPFVFAMMLLAGGLLEFIYEVEFVMPQRTRQAIVKPTNPPKIGTPIDYYFLLDNTTSLMGNDPDKKRIDVLENIIDTFPDDRKIALISFADEAVIHIKPTYASTSVKENFKKIINNLQMINVTDFHNALQAGVSILQSDHDRREVVIFITDGEYPLEPGTDEFNYLMEPYIQQDVSINTIFLNGTAGDSSLLSAISSITNGASSTVTNPVDLEFIITNVIEVEETKTNVIVAPITKPEKLPAKRDLLEKRIDSKQNSLPYILMHIIFITIIGFLMGYALYMVFSNRRLFKPFLIGGGISGLLAGLVLELGLQSGVLPVFVVRLLACVILSTIFWLISFITGWIITLRTYSSPFAFLDFMSERNKLTNDYFDNDQNNKLKNNEAKQEHGDGSLDSEKKNQQSNSGVLH